MTLLHLASLSPAEWYQGGNMAVLILVAVVAMGAVIYGADWLVEGAAGVAAKLGMPKIIIGATIVSLGTTAPEAAVSVLAAFSGNAGLALGNGVGSIIADTGLIFGMGCVLVALPADKFVLKRQGWVQFGSALILSLLCWVFFAFKGYDATLGWPIGVLFLGMLVAYLAISVKWAKQHTHGEPHLIEGASQGDVEMDTHNGAEDKPLIALFGLGVLGLLVVIGSGDALVGSVSELARQWEVPDVVISGTIVAFGTSLPELVVGIQSLRKGHAELLVGNVIGADILNVLFVIGAAAVAAPLSIAYDQATDQPTTQFVYVALPTMMAMLIYFRFCIFKASKQGHFSKWMGYPLLIGYAAFTVVSFLLAR
ncbi:MAG: sodium:calcium antiporter [Phycisphaeraceae bacterium]|nr:sodium:calcium antiporter [Phycisphaeraceae bacterium]